MFHSLLSFTHQGNITSFGLGCVSSSPITSAGRFQFPPRKTLVDGFGEIARIN